MIATAPSLRSRGEEVMESTQAVSPRRLWGLRRVGAFAVLIALSLLARGSLVHAQAAQLDICGCKNNPASLGDFDDRNLTPAQQQVITHDDVRTLEIRLPPDGVMVFDSLTLALRPNDFGCCLTINFTRSAANSPVTLLVKGDVYIGSQVTLSINGESAVPAGTNSLGVGGRGGPGGVRGNDGAYQLV